MKIIRVQERNPMLTGQLVKIWRDSVKETHLFLSDAQINEIEAYIPQALSEIPHLIIAQNERGTPAAFMGIDGQKLEMLFIAPAERGRGLGKRLVRYGIAEYAVRELGVNEQNPQARGFYEHMGFQVYKRTETDEQGMPYPILYMRLP
ncbi:GNAT family N-acetyltransferase [Pseudoflavonifractor phocaeensis]|uniref:GNAT family N-acetyltransferase n=1 Tax=Pseudoflavonifractor phocaeensis TaxID=1870988 RepID=UPI002108B94F|nr:GNAT family N-acetyltransferase [Pseudoflavonifractor phocaeensis]MCQ4864848.1 GNAT family N-acetyltransferase [Pseudoflavonifractor phocaeensis]